MRYVTAVPYSGRSPISNMRKDSHSNYAQCYTHAKCMQGLGLGTPWPIRMGVTPRNGTHSAARGQTFCNFPRGASPPTPSNTLYQNPGIQGVSLHTSA